MRPRFALPWRAISALGLTAVAAASQVDLPAQRLHRAALAGDVDQVGALLVGGADANMRDEDGRTPLMWACFVLQRFSVDGAPPVHRDYAAVAKLLLDKGANVDARDSSRRTALLMAVEGAASEYRVIGADEEMVRLLVTRGANVNAQDDEGWSPLLRTVNLWADESSLISFLIAHGADVKVRLKGGRTALMLSARLGKADRLGELMDNGANVNAADEQGQTALMVAAVVSSGDSSLQMMRLLLARGSDPNRTDRLGRTAADVAAEAGYLDRAQFLLQHGAKVPDRSAFLTQARNQALRRAIGRSSTEEAKALLDEGGDPNFRDATGRTLLMIAADNEYTAEKVKLLLDRGARVNAQGPGGLTALMVAADRYEAETVAALTGHGADPNAADSSGDSVLMHAAASKQSWKEERQPLIHLLIEKGADVNKKDSREVTALMLMAAAGNPAIELLLHNRANVSARDAEGNTALLYGARFFARGWQRRDGWALLESGADVNVRNLHGETALILAATQSDPDAVRLLLAKGANVNAKTDRGRTALMQAVDGPKDFDNERHVVYSPAIAKVLLEAGADVNARDNDGNTALTLALRRGYAEMAAALREAGARE